MCTALVSGIVTGDAPVSYWPFFLLSLVQSQRSLRNLTQLNCLLISKVANELHL